MTFTRTISSNEQLYLAGKTPFSDLVIQVAIKGKGHIDLADLKNAITQVSYQFPGTCLKRVKNTWVSNNQPPPIVLLDESLDLTNNFNRLVNNHSTFSPKQGHTCEVAAVLQKNNCLIVFRALHAVMDGKGLELWAKAVFQALRGQKVPLANSTLTDDIITANKPTRKDEPLFPNNIGPIIG